MTAGRPERYELNSGRKYPDVPRMLSAEESTNQHNKLSTKLESEKDVISYWNTRLRAAACFSRGCPNQFYRQKPVGLAGEFSKVCTSSWCRTRD